MPVATLYTTIDICATRLSLLTEGGAPLTGASNGYVDNSVRSLGIEIPSSGGGEVTSRNGCGTLLASRLNPDLPSGVNLDTEFGFLDSIIQELLVSATPILSAGDHIGVKGAAVGTQPVPVCFEAWSKLWKDSNIAVDPFTSPAATYIHWVFPYTLWTPGTTEVNGDDFSVFPYTAVGRDNGSITANGPFDDWPTAVANTGGMTTSWGWFFDDAVPTGDGEYVAVTSAAS